MSNPKDVKHPISSSRSIGKLSLEIEPDSLRKIVGEGRLLEFATALGAHAASQISAQLVENLATAAVTGTTVSGASVGFSIIFEGGDFATVPPRPRFGVSVLDAFAGGKLQQFVGAERIASS